MARNDQTSYIFAKCKGERAHTVSQIEHIPNVESCTPVTGRFDLVIKLGTNEPTKPLPPWGKSRKSPTTKKPRPPNPSKATTKGPTKQTAKAHTPSPPSK